MGITAWAVIADDGTTARGHNIVSSTRTIEGTYEVTTDRDIRFCAYIASVGGTGSGQPASGYVTTYNAPAGQDETVVVETWQDNGARRDRPFHLTVLCP
jgi:hypothetical protein